MIRYIIGIAMFVADHIPQILIGIAMLSLLVAAPLLTSGYTATAIWMFLTSVLLSIIAYLADREG